MHNEPEAVALRYEHRPGRDDRMTMHADLTARALGADRVVLPDNAGHSTETVENVTNRFGGPFEVELTEVLSGVIRNQEGKVVHLTMYGGRAQDVEADIRRTHTEEPSLVVVGEEKVPFEIYEGTDWNVDVTNQPHSEIAGLAMSLNCLFDGHEFNRKWEDAENRVVSMATGEEVVPAGEEQSERRCVRLRFSAAREQQGLMAFLTPFRIMAFGELLNDPVIQKHLHELVGPAGMPIAAALPDNKVTDEELTEELRLEFNGVRRALFILYENDLASYRCIRDEDFGWLTYLWTFHYENIPENLEKEVYHPLDALEERLGYERNHGFYLPEPADIRFELSETMEHGFQCPETGARLESMNNNDLVDAMERRIKELRDRLSVKVAGTN